MQRCETEGIQRLQIRRRSARPEGTAHPPALPNLSTLGPLQPDLATTNQKGQRQAWKPRQPQPEPASERLAKAPAHFERYRAGLLLCCCTCSAIKQAQVCLGSRCSSRELTSQARPQGSLSEATAAPGAGRSFNFFLLFSLCFVEQLPAGARPGRPLGDCALKTVKSVRSCVGAAVV